MSSKATWSLGIASDTGQFIRIIPRGTPIPARRVIVVTTVSDFQPNIGLDIRLGERDNAAENFALSNIKLDSIEPALKGVPRVKLTFCAYEHSVFKLWVCYNEGDKEREAIITPSTGLSGQEIAALKKMIDTLVKETTPTLEDPGLGLIPLPAIA
jgi:molecular chaperone DnaK (HSP70)